MTTEAAALVAILIGACTRPDLLSSSPPEVRTSAPDDVRANCSLASGRCSQCHSLERVIAQDPSGPSDWRPVVRRMRMMPGSMIAGDEEDPIVRCLVYRSFGLDAARREAP